MRPMEFNESPMAVVAKHQKAAPVMLGPIASGHGIRVTGMPLGKSIAGQIMRDPLKGGPSGFSILIHSDDGVRRRRFARAHELAHFILHRDVIESGIVDDTMYRSELNSK